MIFYRKLMEPITNIIIVIAHIKLQEIATHGSPPTIV